MNTNRRWLRGFAVRGDDGTTAQEGPIPFVAANEGRMADGLDLRMDTADLTRYLANPVVMYGHDYWGRQALPIGRAPTTRVDSSRLLTDLEFDMGDTFAADVDRKIRGQFLNAVSIGFDAHDIGSDGVPARWELFEISVVPLPMDPNATAADGRGALALARSLAGFRGRGLTVEHVDLIEAAVDNLLAVLDTPAEADDEDDARSRRQPAPPAGTPRLTAARRRLFASGL